MQWPAGTLPYELPFTLGHENAGWIEAVGAGVTGWDVGTGGRRLRPVGLRALPRVSHHARDAVRARQRRSAPPAAASAATAAWPSTCSCRDTRLLVPLGDLDPRDAAPLSDAALTPYHALKLALPKLVPGTSRPRDRRRRPRSHGRAAGARDDPGRRHRGRRRPRQARPRPRDRRVGHRRGRRGRGEAVRELTDGRGVALVLDCVGTDATMALDAASVSSGGSVMVIGVAGGTLPLTFGDDARSTPASPTRTGAARSSSPRSSTSRGPARIHAHVEHFPLDRADEAYQRMREGSLSGPGRDHAQRLRPTAGGAVLRPRRRRTRCAGA